MTTDPLIVTAAGRAVIAENEAHGKPAATLLAPGQLFGTRGVPLLIYDARIPRFCPIQVHARWREPFLDRFGIEVH